MPSRKKANKHVLKWQRFHRKIGIEHVNGLSTGYFKAMNQLFLVQWRLGDYNKGPVEMRLGPNLYIIHDGEYWEVYDEDPTPAVHTW